MRVLLANTFFYPRGGDCVHVLMLEALLREAGHDVAILSMEHSQNVESPWAGYWVENVDYSGRNSPIASARMLRRSLYYRPAARAMRRLIRDFRPDVVHLHSIQPELTLSCVVAAKQERVPVVWTLHDYRLVCPATDMLRRGMPCRRCQGGAFWHCVEGRCKRESLAKSVGATMESYLARALGVLPRVDSFIAPSRFLARTVLAMGLPAAEIVVVPNPVRAAPRNPSVAYRGTREVLYVGRLSREKGVDVLIDAVSLVPGLRLTIVGDGPDQSRLLKSAADCADRVAFAGWQPHEVIRDLMGQAAVLAVPSTWYENCPLVVLEAMAEGLPVVASDIGGLTELLGGGRYGFLAPPGQATEWARILQGVVTSAEEAAMRAALAKQRVADRHGPNRFMWATLGAYRRAVSRCQRAG